MQNGWSANKTVVFLLSVWVFSITAFSQTGLPLFIENVGQFDPRALFQVWGGGQTLWITSDAIWITLVEPRKPSEPREKGGLFPFGEEEEKPRKVVNIKISFPGANPNARLEPFGRLDTVVSYFIGNDPAKWRVAVPVWAGVRYVNLYPGVDLEFRSEAGQVVPRLVAHPGADLSAVRLRVEGAEAVALTPGGGGGLLLRTAVGEFILPLFQVEGGSAEPALVQQVDGLAFEVSHPFTAGNKAVNALSSVVQPQQVVSLLYAGFLGGSGGDEGRGIAVDSSGNAYVTGRTCSSDFPTLVGPDLSDNGDWDAFVAKVNPAGTALVYAGFLGGWWIDEGHGIAVDSSGNAYVTGYTRSSDFPAVVGPDLSYNGGYGDAFVAKVNPAGTALVYAGFLGGSDWDEGYGIAVDSSGNAYVTGMTGSPDFPVVVGPDTSFNGGYDAFVVKLGTGTPLGQGYIRGQVKDASTSKAIQGATVEASGPTTSSTTTDSNGNYTLTLPPGTYTLTAKASGYQSQTKTNIAVTAGETLTVDFVLAPVAAALKVTGIEPSEPSASGEEQWLAILGQGFAPGARVNVYCIKEGKEVNVPVSKVKFVSEDRIEVWVALNWPGSWSLEVVNPDGTKSNRFPFSVGRSVWWAIAQARDSSSDVYVVVDGNQYVIATLRYKIDPTTLEPVEGSGPIHVYLDLQGNPISDPEVARKVGQIDWALKRKPEIPGKISDLTYRKTLVERIDSLRNQLNSTEFVLKRIKDVATAVQYKEELLALMRTMKETYWLMLEYIRVTGSSVEITHLEYFEEKIEIYIGLIEKKEITIDVVKAIQGFLVQGACWLLKKMFFDPEKEAHAELLGCLNLALQYYQEAGRLANTDLKNFENASQFVAAVLYGDGYLKAADYLWGKLMPKFLDTSRHILSKCKELGLDFVTLGFYPFLKLAWQASELTNWTVDVLYQKTYTLLSVPAYLRYWLFESATYTLELAGKQRDIREYQRKFDDADTEAMKKAGEVHEAAWRYWSKGEFLQAILDTVKEIGGKVTDFIKDVFSKVKGIFIKAKSPVELRVWDSQGRVTGVVNGEVKEEIPSSLYDPGENAVLIWDLSDLGMYRYEVVGIAEGVYGLEIIGNQGEETPKHISVSETPISSGAKDQYTVDWSGERVEVSKDRNGDGFFEETTSVILPREPSDPFPASGAKEIPTTVTLSWKGGSSDPSRSLTYRIYFGLAEDPSLAAVLGPFPASQDLISWNPGPLLSGKTYFWRVVARDDQGFEREGPTWSFTTIHGIFFADFSSLEGWTKTGLWHLQDTACFECDLMEGSFAYYAQPDGCTYEVKDKRGRSVRTSGTLTSPIITIPKDTALTLQFDFFREVERYTRSTLDRTYVQIRLGTSGKTVRWGSWKTIWSRSSKDPSPECNTASYTFQSKTYDRLQIRFVFDSVNGNNNQYRGWAIDNLVVKPAPTPTKALEVTDLGLGWDVPEDFEPGEMKVLNIPNPITDVHTTVFTVLGVEAEGIKVEVYDLAGRLVWKGEAEGNELPWDTRDLTGLPLANGVYLYLVYVKVEGEWIVSDVQKLVILR